MYAVGHIALGYLMGKIGSKALKVDVNIPLLLVLSVLSDIDLLIPGLKHRGPTHSIILASLLFIPFLALYRKMAILYFASLIQHSLLGDFITGGGMLLWPFSSSFYGIQIEMMSLTNISIEWISFVLFLAAMLKTGDMKEFFHHHSSNLLLSIPIFTALLPTFLNFPAYVPLELVAPHLVYIMLFAISILVGFEYKARTTVHSRRK